MSALRDEIARAIDPDAFDDSKPKSTRQVAVLQWSVRRKMANDAASAVLPIVREREAEALREAADAQRAMAVDRFDERGPHDARGAAIWDSANWLGLRAGGIEARP